MKRAARAALKWKKEVSRRAADRAAGKDTNRKPPSGFEDVVLLLLDDSKKKTLDQTKQRGDGGKKRHTKGDVATGSGQRVSASSIRGGLNASIDMDARRRPSAVGGKSAPECGSNGRKNKKRARGRSQSFFRWVPVCFLFVGFRCRAIDLQRPRWSALLGGRRPERRTTREASHSTFSIVQSSGKRPLGGECVVRDPLSCLRLPIHCPRFSKRAVASGKTVSHTPNLSSPPHPLTALCR